MPALHVAESAVEVAISCREHLYRFASPVDALVGRLTRRVSVPPLWLRRHIGSAGASRFLSVVSDAESLLDELLDGRSFDTVLDLGCGCGAMAPYFQRRLPRDGRYLGIDVHGGCVRWCRENFQSDERLAFRTPPLDAASPAAGRYDLVLAKSLFTHLTPREAVDALAAISERLSDQGRLVLTAFLFDSRNPVPALPHSRMNGRVRHRHLLRPRAAVGFDRALFAEWLGDAGLQIDQSRLWFWPGDHAELSAQDILVCRKRSGRAPEPGAAFAAGTPPVEAR